MPNLLR